jgi:hypothetical protein
MNRRLWHATLSGVLFATSSAGAAKPTKQECAAANESAQDLRRAGKLRDARAHLAVCTAASCPGPIREDCAQRLKEVEAAIPTVVLVASDSAGNDLSAVRVTMDGDVLLDKLGGAAIAVDPGEHRFVFESEGLRKAENVVLVREGDVDRQVRVVLKAANASSGTESAIAPPAAESVAPSTSEAAAASPGDGSTRRALGISLVAAGAAAGVVGAVFAWIAKSTYDRARQNECGGNANHCTPQGTVDGQSAHGQATVSTVASVGGLALLAGGAVLYFTAPASGDGPSPASQQGRGRSVGVAVAPTIANGGGGLSLTGAW